MIPCYNERRTLAAVVDRVLASPVALAREIVLVDDGSTDGSADLIRALVARHAGTPGVTLRSVLLPANRGKGAALRAGFAAATGDIVLVQDADLEYDPDDYPALVKPILDGLAQVVYGSRWLNRHFHRRQPGHWHFVAGNWLVTRLTNLLYRAHVTDAATGYKVFDARVLRALPLRCEGFEFCPEVTARVRKLGYRIWEVPVCYAPRTVAEGKKIRGRDGAQAVWTLLRYRVGD